MALIDTANGARVRMFETAERDGGADPSERPGEAAGAGNQAADLMKQVQELTGMLGANSPMAMGSGASLVSSGSLINFTPDGKLLVAANSSAVWDLAAGTPRKVPQERAQVFRFLVPGAVASEGVFSADGKTTAAVDTGAGAAVVIRRLRAAPLSARFRSANGRAANRAPCHPSPFRDWHLVRAAWSSTTAKRKAPPTRPR